MIRPEGRQENSATGDSIVRFVMECLSFDGYQTTAWDHSASRQLSESAGCPPATMPSGSAGHCRPPTGVQTGIGPVDVGDVANPASPLNPGTGDTKDALHALPSGAALGDLAKLLALATCEGAVLAHNGRIVCANEQLEHMLGYQQSELSGLSFLDCVAPESHDLVSERIASRRKDPVQIFALRNDGSKFPAEVSGRILCVDGRELYLASIRDITEWKTTEAKLRRTQHSIDHAREAIFWLEADARVVYANDAACASLGYTREELLRLSVFDFDPNVRPEQWGEIWEESLRLKSGRMETCHRTKDGRVFPVEIEVDFLVFEGKNYHCCFVRDLSERKKTETERLELERRVLHAEKLESLGVLAGGIAHDFNNLLMAMQGNLDLALAHLPIDAPCRSNIEQTLIAARRAADLTRQMLAYSGRGRFDVRRIDLNGLTKENACLFRASVSHLTTLDLSLASALPTIVADCGQIQQVIMNLLTNAAEAIGEHAGRITLRTGHGFFDANYLGRGRQVENPPPGRYVFLEVTDTGCGMDEATLCRFFDPFFTTKSTGRGLGTAALLGIVRGHRGAIFVDSIVGRGTTVRALFPAVESVEDAQAIVPKASPPTVVGRGLAPRGTILVVDDEDLVREVCGEMVERHGWTVLLASDGHNAVEALRQNPVATVCAIVDLSMPGRSGLEVAGDLRRIAPQLKIILSSGFSDEDVTSQFVEIGICDFIQKPYDLRRLGAVLSRVLGAPPDVR